MADDRRIITGTHVIAREGKDLETGTKYIIDSTVAKSLGGKSTVTDMDATQWHASNWYSETTTIDGSNLHQLSSDVSPVKFLYIRNLDATGQVVVSLGVEQTWDGVWSAANNWDDSTYTDRPPNYDGWWDEGSHIRIPAGGSIQLRGDDTNGSIKDVYIRTQHGQVSGTIKYIIAQ
jgi:hypothetical protein